MDKNMEIVAALKLCGTPEFDDCDGCPYNGRTDATHTCRALLCLDAAEALEGAARRSIVEEVESLLDERTGLLEKLKEAQENLAKKHTSVCFEINGLHNDVRRLGEELEEFKGTAHYYRGQADALKWFINFYLTPETTLKEAVLEVQDGV